jgi:hypothetical protein
MEQLRTITAYFAMAQILLCNHLKWRLNMKNVNKKFLYAYCLAMLLSCTAFAHDKSDKDANYSGAMKSIPYATITFDSNSAVLTDSDKAALRTVVEKARSKGTLSEVTVASWSDKKLPKQGQTLADEDRDLAVSRSGAIADYLKNVLMVKADVDSYNMAETSNWMARTFRTSDAELKSQFSKQSAQTPVTNAEFQIIKNEGAPGEAIVVLQCES